MWLQKKTEFPELTNQKLNIDELLYKFIDFKQLFSNLFVFTCYKQLFSPNGIKQNSASYINIIIIITSIVFIIIFYLIGYLLFQNKLDDILAGKIIVNQNEQINQTEGTNIDNNPEHTNPNLENPPQRNSNNNINSEDQQITDNNNNEQTNEGISNIDNNPNPEHTNPNLENPSQRNSNNNINSEKENNQMAIPRQISNNNEEKTEGISNIDNNTNTETNRNLENPTQTNSVNNNINSENINIQTTIVRQITDINNNNERTTERLVPIINNHLNLNPEPNRNFELSIKANSDNNIIYYIINMIDYEYKNLEYIEALDHDQRTFWEMFWSLFKIKHNLIFIFVKNDYNIIQIKICLFLFWLSIEYTMNGLFYSDKTMHKMHEYNGKYKFLYHLPTIIYPIIISNVITELVEYFALTEEKIAKIVKEKRDLIIVKREIKKCINAIKWKFITFFISFILLLFLFWYYLSSFCAVFYNTQKPLIIDTIIGYGLSLLLYPSILVLIICSLRYISLKRNFRCSRWLYKKSEIIGNIIVIILTVIIALLLEFIMWSNIRKNDFGYLN